jgi:Cu/Zn superoxide dismutase
MLTGALTSSSAAIAIAALAAAGCGRRTGERSRRVPDAARRRRHGPRDRGFTTISRSDAGTQVKAVVRGLEPGTTYAAHLHDAPCSAANPGGAHHKNDPAGPSVPPNELWLSSTDDPMAGITGNPGGVAHGRGSADWVARPHAQSVVIHFIPPGGTTAGGPKIACADLE